jgi:hypothetical protein
VPEGLFILQPATEYNLDAMSSDELEEFLDATKPTSAAVLLFPGRPRGYMAATFQLRCYAEKKIVAMALRKEGRVEAAQGYEAMCDRIYTRLPSWAKGW